MIPGRLDDIAALAMLLCLAAVQAAALVLQFGFGEAPCPLCLLERVAMFGACLGPILHFRPGSPARAAGLGLVAAVFLLVVSARQVLLDIVPRPGHAYVGSAVLGLHMPVWAVVIAVALVAGFAGRLALFGATPHDATRPAGSRGSPARRASSSSPWRRSISPPCSSSAGSGSAAPPAERQVVPLPPVAA